MNTKRIAGLIAMSVPVGTAAANSVVGIKAYNKNNQEVMKQQI